jgi:hypothetical protein
MTALINFSVSLCMAWRVQLLESCFLVSATLVLMAGMVFSADGFTRGSTGYTLLTVLVMVVLIGTTASFSALLLFEIYRSVKLAGVFALARRVEEEAMEEAVLGRRLRRRTGASATDGVGMLTTLRRHSGLARRISVVMGVTAAPAMTAGEGSVGCATDSGPSRGVTDVARRRRSSLLARLQEVVHDVSGSGVGLGKGRGRIGDVSGAPVTPAAIDAATAEDSGRVDPGCAAAAGALVSVLLPAPPAALDRVLPPSPPPQAPRASNGGRMVPPKPPPPADDRLAPRAPGGAGTGNGRRRVQVDVGAAAVAARSMRVHTMASRQRSPKQSAKPDSENHLLPP